METGKSGGERLEQAILAFALLFIAAACAVAQDAPVRRVGVLAFDSAHIGASGNTASDLFDSFLVKGLPGLSVVERNKLALVLGEQQLQHASGLVDRETASRLKALLGVDSLVFGRIIALEHAVDGGAGTLMMNARLVDIASGRILWADTVTVKVSEKPSRRFLRALSGARGESDALVTNRLLEKATSALASAMSARVGRGLETDDRPAPLVTTPVVPAGLCAEADTRIDRLGESVVSEEALYWAHRLREDGAVDGTPGAGYSDPALRRRLNNKVLFWLDEKDLPALTGRQWQRLADAKAEMAGLLSGCGLSARKAGPPAALLLASGSR